MQFFPTLKSSGPLVKPYPTSPNLIRTTLEAVFNSAEFKTCLGQMCSCFARWIFCFFCVCWFGWLTLVKHLTVASRFWTQTLFLWPAFHMQHSEKKLLKENVSELSILFCVWERAGKAWWNFNTVIKKTCKEYEALVEGICLVCCLIC